MHPASPRCTQHPTPTPALGSGAQAPEPEPELEPGRGWPLQAPRLARRSPGGTAEPRPERAGSAPAQPHPMDPPGSQSGDGRSERAAAEPGPGVLTRYLATVRPPGEGEVVRSSPGDLPRGPPAPPRGGSAAPAPPSAQRHRGGRVCPLLPGPMHPPAGQSHQALQELEKKRGGGGAGAQVSL